jgi:uncharacterized protein (DUF58 family)
MVFSSTETDSSGTTPIADGRTSVSLRQLIDMQYKARGFRFASPHIINSVMMGRHKSRTRGRGLNFEELRHYRQGDDIRNMDWKVTNRTGKPHVRVYSEERERRVMLVVDQRSAMLFGSTRVMKSVAAAELMALAAWRSLDAGDRVGALIFNDHEISEVRPHRSRTQIMRMLSILQRHNAELLETAQTSVDEASLVADGDQLNHVLTELNALAGHDMQIVLVSDLYGADSVTEKLIAQLSQHNDVMLGFIYDPMEAKLPDAGRLAVSDGRMQLEVDTKDQALQKKYSLFFEQRLARAHKFLQSYAVPVLPLSTTDPIDEQLENLMQGVLT